MTLQSLNQDFIAGQRLEMVSLRCMDSKVLPFSPLIKRTSTYVVSGKVVNVGLGQHGVVLELALAQRRSVASNDNQLGLASAQTLEGRLVSQRDCKSSVLHGIS